MGGVREEEVYEMETDWGMVHEGEEVSPAALSDTLSL